MVISPRYNHVSLQMLQYEGGKTLFARERGSIGGSVEERGSSISLSTGSLLSPEAWRLLEEYTLCYQFTATTKLVTTLQCIAMKIKEEIIRFEDISALQEIAYQVRRISFHF